MELSDWGFKFLRMREAPGGKPILKAYRNFTDEPWTIAFGHTKEVYGGMMCTPQQADNWLRDDVEEVEDAINRLVKVFIVQKEFDALVSLIYNVGIGAFSKSQALKCLNKYDRAGFEEQAFTREHGFVRVNGQIVEGLVKRRYLEEQLFIYGEWGELTA